MVAVRLLLLVLVLLGARTISARSTNSSSSSSGNNATLFQDLEEFFQALQHGVGIHEDLLQDKNKTPGIISQVEIEKVDNSLNVTEFNETESETVGSDKVKELSSALKNGSNASFADAAVVERHNTSSVDDHVVQEEEATSGPSDLETEFDEIDEVVTANSTGDVTDPELEHEPSTTNIAEEDTSFEDNAEEDGDKMEVMLQDSPLVPLVPFLDPQASAAALVGEPKKHQQLLEIKVMEDDDSDMKYDQEYLEDEKDPMIQDEDEEEKAVDVDLEEYENETSPASIFDSDSTTPVSQDYLAEGSANNIANELLLWNETDASAIPEEHSSNANSSNAEKSEESTESEAIVESVPRNDSAVADEGFPPDLSDTFEAHTTPGEDFFGNQFEGHGNTSGVEIGTDIEGQLNTTSTDADGSGEMERKNFTMNSSTAIANEDFETFLNISTFPEPNNDIDTYEEEEDKENGGGGDDEEDKNAENDATFRFIFPNPDGSQEGSDFEYHNSVNESDPLPNNLTFVQEEVLFEQGVPRECSYYLKQVKFKIGFPLHLYLFSVLNVLCQWVCMGI